jgi:hypothetical protein
MRTPGLVAGLVSLLVVAACGSGSGATDGSVFDGSGTAIDAADGDGGTCVGLDGECVLNADCCSERCEGRTCVPSDCLDQGLGCGANGECCSTMCHPDDSVCEAIVIPGDCASFGGQCGQNTDCCSDNCVNQSGQPCGGGGAGCTCGPSVGCLASGDPCSGDSACCNSLCDTPSDPADAVCAAVGACKTAGEPCGTAGYNASCCSTVCLDGHGEGINRCQHLGGCRVQDDLCTNDAECCSGACQPKGQTSDGRPIMRCANVTNCSPVGEVCGGQGSSSNCCPSGGGRRGCEETGAGFSRCFGGGSNCVLAGQPCGPTDQCCTTPPGLECQPGPQQVDICCLPDGEICAFGDLCCSGVCGPSNQGGDPPGTLRCSPECIPNGGACVSDAECCGCCNAGTCSSDCGECTGPQLGDLCVPGTPDPCCNYPTVTCQGTEFARCMLAP